MVIMGYQGVWEGVITFRRCDSPLGGVKDVRKVSVDGEVCCSWEKCTGAWESMTVVRKCDSHQGGVKGIRKVHQLMERCDGHGGDVKVLGEV